ncbi:ABC transporter ATP-binding protein [Pelagicoccus sp. SDUM812003]|uniref:ABC transporter ATP-binding protein n=1 Tax=Pelagicoccus sp. SDUM812003 TaxID=3041267 RepID=UPI00280DFFE8|nr:ABC transporter ATP-binding protein [Pelagicoccus sp. SDUM812003]MDQ8203093.1 ABC transporter ATP-binding protein [Pelagicoccus sp. SDUM812003]
MSAIIEAKELSCFYGVVLGLNNVTFDVSSGITGLVGPNGAGKSTLIKLVTGQLAPSSGELSVFGESPRNNAALLKRIGYCPEREQVPKDLKPVDWLRSLASLSGIRWKDTKNAAEAALERARLDSSHWSKPIGAYSKGMKQRVKLAQAIMHDPELVILDEPMNGLDPMGRAEFGEILKELSLSGASILISSHILHELEFLCGGFLILNWGRVLASGSQLEIREAMTQWSDEISIRCSDPIRLASHLQESGAIRGYLSEQDELTVWVKRPESFFEDWPRLLAECSTIEIYSLRNKNRSLSSIFERMTR